jgi:hypothetical protein
MLYLVFIAVGCIAGITAYYGDTQRGQCFELAGLKRKRA